MNLENAKLFYIISCVFLGFVILAPALFAVAPLPGGESFSELWILGENHVLGSGTLNVLINTPYTVYLGVSNHMGSLEYYTVYVKLRSQAQAFQENGTPEPSSLESIFQYRLFLENNETWEKDFTFSFEKVSFEQNESRVSLLSINDNNVSVDTTGVRDESDGGFYYQLAFELWIYNSTTSAFQYHDRYVSLWLKLINTP